MNLNEHLSIEILADHAEGLLGDADSTAVSEHLAACADCSAESDLLLSVTALLAADDPGPMPAQVAARIDVALAELAAAEPVTPKHTAASPSEGAVVIDLASRRRFSGASRVTSVAASLVLLIGGAALAAQVINSDNSGSPGEDNGATGVTPVVTPTTDSAGVTRYVLTAVPKDAKKGKAGSKIDTTGKVYLKSGTQIYPDGTKVIPQKNAAAKVVVQSSSTRAERRLFTIRNPNANPTPKASTAPITPITPPDDPAIPGAGPTADPATTPAPKVTASASKAQPLAKGDPYVAESGTDYTSENFASKVRLLLQASGDLASAGSTQAQETGGSSSGANAIQPRAVSGAVRADDTTVDRGPAATDAVERVRRCAKQLGYGSVIAGDVARWTGADATIVIVANPADSDQVIGYAVSGDCTEKDPATRGTALWEQPVAKPGPAVEETTRPEPTETGTRSPAP